jgi:hypothetical protein
MDPSNLTSMNPWGLVTSSYIASVVVPPGISSFDFDTFSPNNCFRYYLLLKRNRNVLSYNNSIKVLGFLNYFPYINCIKIIKNKGHERRKN